MEGRTVTATSDIQRPALEAPVSESVPRTRARVWRRLLIGFLVGLVLALSAAAAALVAWDLGYEGRVLPGIKIGTTDLSGLDRAGATAALERAYGEYGEGRVVIHTIAGDLPVPYSAFSRRLDVDALVDRALQTGRNGSVTDRAVGQVRLAVEGTTLMPIVSFDEPALRSAIAAALEPLEAPAVNALVGIDANGVRILHSRPGRAFDIPAVQAGVLAVIGSIDAPPELPVDAPMIAIEPDRTDEDVRQVQETATWLGKSVWVKGAGGRWKIPAAKVRSWITIEVAADGSLKPVIDEAAIPKALKQAKKDIARKPVAAQYLRSKSGTIVGVAAGRDGRKLDVDATAAAVVAELQRRAAGQAATSVKPVVVKRVPELTTAEATRKAPLMTRLGSWQTYFPIGERNFNGANIWLPAQIIDGTVLKPGQRFEWWSALGPVTTARGFGLGGYIAGDHTDPTGAMGGGMCSASTTLFNAALRAGLSIGARDNHRYYIERYPLGLDATVSSAQTLSFTNDMKTPILIRGFKIRGGGSQGFVRFEIWGVDDGRTVSISKPSVRNVRQATTNTVYVNTLKPGVREQTEYPANGMDVTVSRVVRNGNGKVIHRDSYVSPYQLWNGRIEVGR
jgi:vancomycin resistance protein YoaR